jgi:glyoxylase I family protein
MRVTVEPVDKVIPSAPPYPVRLAFCIGPLGEEVEFFCER